MTDASADRRPLPPRLVLAAYTASIFLGAFLLFLVQPMFSRMVLPLLGGTAAVWNTCMLFFQAALLGGYLYAHASVRVLGPRRQAAAHLVLLALAALALPVAIGSAAPRGGEAPIPWLLGTMALTVGLPFFVLSATGPLLQAWFARTGHPDARNPYFLYAASNLGSMLALLGYPVLVEPRLRLAGQSAAWTAGYVVLALLMVGCAGVLWRGPRGAEDASAAVAPAEVQDEPSVRPRERAAWVLLAFVPSSLLLSVTTFITTDITPAPLFWVLPLALYLLTFTLAFAKRPPIPHALAVRWQPVVLVATVVLLLAGSFHAPMVLVPLHLAAMGLTALVCHGELARRRPGVGRLTEFYLWISVGGALGGCFNVLLAPVAFPRMEEYPLVLTLACLLRPRTRVEGRTSKAADAAALAALAAGLVLVVRPEMLAMKAVAAGAIATMLVAVAALHLGRTPGHLAAVVGAALLLRAGAEYRRPGLLGVERTFFGRYTVQRDGPHHLLYHGTTVHGAQDRRPERRGEPLTYYARGGPVGNVFAAIPARPGRRIALVGLGTGSAAAYGRAGESWDWYEIDPGIERLARDTALFTYLADAPQRQRVVLGDARLSLAAVPDGTYDLVLLDAFNSDAVPVHLLTREAMGLYLRKLSPGGLVVLHLSNRYLDLPAVVAALARERGLAALVSTGLEVPGERIETTTWAVVARRPEHLGALTRDLRWSPPEAPAGLGAWTDDFSDLWSVLQL